MPLAAAALRRRADRRRHPRGRARGRGNAVPRAARRARAGGVRRLHARGGAGRPVPLGGAAAEASRGRHPAPPPAASASLEGLALPDDPRRLPLLTVGLADRPRPAAA